MSNIRQRHDPMPPGFTVEFRLLAASTLRPPPHQHAQWLDQIATLAGQVTDWQALSSLVSRHQVFAQVHEALQELQGRVAIPREILDTLAATARRSRLQGMLRLAETRRLAEVLQREQIPAVQLKGTPLSQQLYGDPLMRYSSDIDVLVPLALLSDTVQRLKELGYSTDERMPLAGGLQSQLQRRAYHHCMLHNRANVHLELHWRLGTCSEAQSNRLFEQALDDATTGLKVLPRPFELTYLVAHGTGHYWSRLKWLSDIQQALLTLPPAAWEGFGPQSLKAGVGHAVEMTRCMLGWVFGTSGVQLPQCVPRPQARHLRSARYALQRILSPYEPQRGMRAVFDRALYRLDCGTPYQKFTPVLRYVDTMSRSRAGHS